MRSPFLAILLSFVSLSCAIDVTFLAVMDDGRRVQVVSDGEVSKGWTIDDSTHVEDSEHPATVLQFELSSGEKVLPPIISVVGGKRQGRSSLEDEVVSVVPYGDVLSGFSAEDTPDTSTLLSFMYTCHKTGTRDISVTVPVSQTVAADDFFYEGEVTFVWTKECE
jgi:hypothetical protein